MVVAYESQIVLHDLETKKQLVRFESEGIGGVNRIICHPTLGLTITAHEDRHIRFWDNSTGKMLHAMVAHLDAVTSLALDPHGLYLLSGSKTNKLCKIMKYASVRCSIVHMQVMFTVRTVHLLLISTVQTMECGLDYFIFSLKTQHSTKEHNFSSQNKIYIYFIPIMSQVPWLLLLASFGSACII
jgi:WD40 repeat protein